jgi:hypothetical protein
VAGGRWGTFNAGCPGCPVGADAKIAKIYMSSGPDSRHLISNIPIPDSRFLSPEGRKLLLKCVLFY